MRRALQVLVVLVSTMSAVAQMQPTAPAAPTPPQLTWLRFYSVDRGRTSDFMDTFNRVTAPVFDRLIADRQIVSWGLAVPFTRTGGDWTHLVWITVNNWAAADNVVRALDESDRNRPAADVQRDQQTMVSAIRGSRDVVLRHALQSTTPPGPTFKPQYIRVSFFTVKPGRSDDAVATFRDYNVALYNDLSSRGVIGPWGLSTQDLATDPSFTHVVWYFTDSLQRLDAVRDANMARPADVRNAMAAKVRDFADPDKFRSEILRIVRINMAGPAR